MKTWYTIGVLMILQTFVSCKDKPHITVEEVKLEDIKLTDSVEPPPPPPPPRPVSNSITMQEWFKILCKEHPDKSIIAYNFGLMETEDGLILYLTGSKEYDKNNPDWASNEDFTPEFNSYSLTGKEYKGLKWNQALDLIILQLKEFAKTPQFKSSFFAKAKAITAGFDDGDLVRIK